MYAFTAQRLQLRELEPLLVQVLVIGERLEEERDVERPALGADPLEEYVLAVVHVLVVERVVVQEDLDRVRARLDEAPHAPVLEQVRGAVLWIGVVPGLSRRRAARRSRAGGPGGPAGRTRGP